RNIESRLQMIRNTESDKPLDVVIKQIPAQTVLSIRTTFPSLEAAMTFFSKIVSALPNKSSYGLFFGVWHSDGIDDESMDMEMGRVITAAPHAPVLLSDNLRLTIGELPAVERMATFVVKGSTENMHMGYSTIGIWAEVNDYRFTGAPRE